MDKLVSIIVPVYNVDKYLEKCIDSIVGQTYTNLQIILVNDGSTDNSLSICQRYTNDERVQLISIENGGLSVARNTGLDIATGDYIVFCDSDDYYDINAFEIMLNAVESEGYDLVVGGFRYIYKDRQQELTIPFKVANNYELMKMFCIENNIISSACAKLYKKELLDGLRYPVGQIYEDRYLSLDIFARVDKALFLGVPLYNYIQRKSSIVHKGFNKNSLFYIDISRREVEYIKNHCPQLLPLIENKVAADIVEVMKWILVTDYSKNKEEYNSLIEQLKIEEQTNGSNKYKIFYTHKTLARLKLQLRFVGGKILRKLRLKKDRNKYFD